MSTTTAPLRRRLLLGRHRLGAGARHRGRECLQRGDDALQGLGLIGDQVPEAVLEAIRAVGASEPRGGVDDRAARRRDARMFAGAEKPGVDQERAR